MRSSQIHKALLLVAISSSSLNARTQGFSFSTFSIVLYQIFSQVALFLGSLNKHSHHSDHRILARLSPVRQEPEGIHVSRLLDMLHVPHRVLSHVATILADDHSLTLQPLSPALIRGGLPATFTFIQWLQYLIRGIPTLPFSFVLFDREKFT